MLYLRCGKKIYIGCFDIWFTTGYKKKKKKKRHKARLGLSIGKHIDILYRARHNNTDSLKNHIPAFSLITLSVRRSLWMAAVLSVWHLRWLLAGNVLRRLMADKYLADSAENELVPQYLSLGEYFCIPQTASFSTRSSSGNSLSSQSGRENKSNELDCQRDIMSQIESYEGETSSVMDSLGYLLELLKEREKILHRRAISAIFGPLRHNRGSHILCQYFLVSTPRIKLPPASINFTTPIFVLSSLSVSVSFSFISRPVSHVSVQ